MKYSLLSVAAFLTACSLGSPGYYWGAALGPSGVTVTNNMNTAVQIVDEPIGIVRVIAQGESAQFPPSANADLKLRLAGAPHNQLEVSYSTGNVGTYDFAIKSIEADHFPGVVHVIPHPARPPKCNALRWNPGDSDKDDRTCPNGTPLQVYLSERHYAPAFEVPYEDAGWY